MARFLGEIVRRWLTWSLIYILSIHEIERAQNGVRVSYQDRPVGWR